MPPTVRRLMRSPHATAAIACCLYGALMLSGTPSRVAAQVAAQQDEAQPNAVEESEAQSEAASTEVHEQQLHKLEDRLSLREPFNKADGAIRVVAFLAPSCPKCLQNAGELQREVLEANEDADIAVFAVWMHVLKNDDEEAARKAMERLPDARAHHYWDPDRKLLHQLRDAIMFDVNLRLYDIFLLYDGDAVWEKRVPRPGYWMHEYKGCTGPWWDIKTFAAEVDKGLRGEPFANPMR